MSNMDHVQPFLPPANPSVPARKLQIVDLTPGGSLESAIQLSDSEDEDDEIQITSSRPVAPSQARQHTKLVQSRHQIPQNQEQGQIVIDVRSIRSDLGPLTYEEGSCVELRDETILRIVNYVPDSPQGPLVIGHRYLLQSHPELFMMQDRSHEVVQLVKADKDLNTTDGYWSIPLHDIARKVIVIHTNQQYETLNYRKDVQGCYQADPNKPIYFCRYTSTDTNIGLDDTDPIQPPKTGKIEHLRADKSNRGILQAQDGEVIELQTPDSQSRRKWRGGDNYTLGGSHSENDGYTTRKKYTFGDAFCGAGGTSAGAHRAGLKMKFAFDLDKDACNTYRLNFGYTATNVKEIDVDDFIEEARHTTEYLVDVLHMSPPCQPFCGANRSPNAEDNERNLHAFAQVSTLLEVCKPRVATLEEAKNLTDKDKRQHFHQLISSFVGKGYSVQWKVMNLWEFGVPQTRIRLIVFACGPGEELPPFPRATHGRAPGLKELPSINKTLSSIPPNAVHQDERPAIDAKTTLDPYNGNKLAGTVMTTVKEQSHPEGGRRFSIRESAALQTFPHDFIFSGGTTAIKLKQIGNAVPPKFAEPAFRGVDDHMKEADAREERHALRQKRRQYPF